jgi:hypothetical protein
MNQSDEIEQSYFYLYYLRRPNEEDPLEPGKWQPFYVGRGYGNRVRHHRKEARNLLKDPRKKNSNPIRNNIIHNLWQNGLDFKEEIVISGLTNKEANYYEIERIAAYGRINLKTGCLANLTDGGEGTVGYVKKIRYCECGCREEIKHGWYLPGHDPELGGGFEHQLKEKKRAIANEKKAKEQEIKEYYERVGKWFG